MAVTEEVSEELALYHLRSWKGAMAMSDFINNYQQIIPSEELEGCNGDDQSGDEGPRIIPSEELEGCNGRRPERSTRLRIIPSEELEGCNGRLQSRNAPHRYYTI